MRITVMGTGGVGGYFGARLAASGEEVTFVARGAHLAAIRSHGLRVVSPLGDLTLRDVRTTERPADIAGADIIVFGVKLWDTEEAAAAIEPLVSAGAAVVSFQNGVVKDDVLGRRLGTSSVIGGACYIAATLAEPGVIKHGGEMARLVFGERDGRQSDRVVSFRDACVRAGIQAEVSTDIKRTIWEKFVFLVGLSALTTATRNAIGVIRENVQARALLHDVMDEVVQVARAEGVALPADFAADRLKYADTLPATMKASMCHDLDRGARLEVSWLSGDVVARGQRLGLPTPCNRVIADLLSLHAGGRPTP